MHAQRHWIRRVLRAFVHHFERPLFVGQVVQQQVARGVAPAGEYAGVLSQPPQRNPLAQVGVRPVGAVVRAQVAHPVELTPAQLKVESEGDGVAHQHGDVLDEDDLAVAYGGITHVIADARHAEAYRPAVECRCSLHQVVRALDVVRGVVVGVAVVIRQLRHVMVFGIAVHVAQAHQQHGLLVGERQQRRTAGVAVPGVPDDIHQQRHGVRTAAAGEDQLVRSQLFR
ncbi:MAG: hypothetical protein BWY76_02987 [bacterium ADurb.Bin429]|nr:MAG: hypothetical protein BWY76_02987 [bacterium ADurb.Bin429]